MHNTILLWKPLASQCYSKNHAAMHAEHFVNVVRPIDATMHTKKVKKDSLSSSLANMIYGWPRDETIERQEVSYCQEL